MLTVLASLVLSQGMIRVSVLDVSASDAIYEDVSRGLAERISDELLKLGFLSRRADESELPNEGCRVGPCLAAIAKTQKADVLLLLDAVEGDKGQIQVALTAMRGRDGLPLAAGKWSTTAAGKADKRLNTFLTALKRAIAKNVTPPAEEAPRPRP
jgi:hypothetical protein